MVNHLVQPPTDSGSTAMSTSPASHCMEEKEEEEGGRRRKKEEEGSDTCGEGGEKATFEVKQ